MQQKPNFFLSGLLLIILALASCSKSNDTSQNQSVANEQLKQGSWKITNFWDKDHDETATFSSFNFTFNGDGTVSASGSSNSSSGTWSTTTDDSQLKLVLFFSTSPFTEINDDWHITNQTDNLIELEDVSGGGGGTETLKLEKI